MKVAKIMHLDTVLDRMPNQISEGEKQRLAVARMLAGGVHYPEIQRVTGASPTTISRVSRCVNYGSGGYEKVIERLGTIEGPGETP
jgi:TrpR-related protein YerC/YecD